jgi:hypothetical protein
MRKFLARNSMVLAAIGSATLLSGCGSSGLFNRDRPDEFAVQRQAPLVIPPDFALTPPAPGAPRPSDRGAAQQAQEALFGPSAPRSEVERAAAGRAGTAAASIRSTVGDPKTSTVAKGEVTRDIVAAPQGDGREAQTVIGG